MRSLWLTAATPSRRADGVAAAAVMAAAALALAFALARMPFLATGAVVGLLLLALALTRPLLVIAVMLALGPLDLSFVTGGFKELFTGLGGLDMNGIRLLAVTAGLSLFVLSERSVLGEAFGRYGRWYLLFLALAAASLLPSASRIDGMRLLLKLACPFLFFLVVLGAARTQRDLSRLIDWALLGAAAITMVLNPLYVLAGGYQFDIGGRLRVWGVGTYANPFSFYMLLMALLSVARFSVRGQIRYLILAGVAAAWMVATLTRITLLASFAALLGVVLFNAVVTRNYRTVAVALGLGGAVGLSLLPIALERTFGYVPSASELNSMLRDPVSLYYMMNWQGREIYWALVYQAFTSSPLIGLGLGSTTALLTANFPAHWGTVPHSEYLRALAEVGLIGTGLYAAAIFAWLGGVLRAARTADRLVREFAMAAIAGILAWALIAATDNAFDYYSSFTQYVGVLCAGAIAAARLRAAEESAGEGEVSESTGRRPLQPLR